VTNAVNATIENYPTELYYANIACEFGAAFATGFNSAFRRMLTKVPEANSNSNIVLPGRPPV